MKNIYSTFLTTLTRMQRTAILSLLMLLGGYYNLQAQFVAEVLTPNNTIREGLSLAHAADGRIFIAERAGIVKVYDNGTVSTAFTVTTTTDSEQGLLGLTLHPDFMTNGYVYVFYTRSDKYHHIIERVQLNASNQEVSRQQILTLDPIEGGFHNGGDLAFFNGYLYITTGDSQNNVNSQNLDNTRGKILRVTADGNPAPGNPFYGSGSTQRQMIWAYGFRNPFRLVANEKAGKLFTLDVGTSWEEINDITDPAPLYNYGWGHPQGGDGAQTETNLFVNPIFAFQTGSIGNALTNGILYNPDVSRYPSYLFDQFIIKDFVRYEMRYFDWTQPNPTATEFYTSPHYQALGMILGNDGYIYYCQYGREGNLIRLKHEQSEAPTIINHPVSQSIVENSPVTFDVDVTGADPISYQWKYNGNDIAGATGSSYAIASVSMSDAGQYSVVVSNNAGSTTSNAATLSVQEFNNAPTVSIVAPAPSLTWDAFDDIYFEATASDVEDGDLPASAFSWSIDLFHEDIPGAGHSHPGASPQGVKSGVYNASSQGEKTPNIWYRFSVTVTDSYGLTATAFVDVDPNLITATVTTAPVEGLQVELNQKPATSPTSQQLVVNANLQVLNAPTPQYVGNTRYDFDYWEHGGAANQSFIAPAQDVTYVAHYTATDVSQQPYNNVVGQIPGQIEAEHYDTGTGAYYDINGGGDGGFRAGDGVGTEGASEGGYNIGWVVAGEWLEYTVNVDQTASYDVGFRIATPNDNRAMRLEVDGQNVTGSVAVPNTGGFQAWQTVTATGIPLTAGSHVIRVHFEANDINFNYMTFSAGSGTPAPVADYEITPSTGCVGSTVTFTSVSLGQVDSYSWNFGSDATPATATGAGPHTVTYSAEGIKSVSLTAGNTAGSDTKTSSYTVETCTGTAQTPFNGSPLAIPGRLEAEEYDTDGEGIAYHDLSAGNSGNTFRTDDVDIEDAGSGSNYSIGWVDGGEWLEYTIDVVEHAEYDITLAVSSPYDNNTIHLEFDGVDITGSITTPNTGGWKNWQTVTVSDIHLHEGVHELRIHFEDGGQNIDYIDFAPTTVSPSAPVSSFTVSDATPCVNSQVTFTSAATGTIDSYSWNFGADATPATATGAGPHTVTYAATGSKTASLTVANTAGSDVSTSAITAESCTSTSQSPYGGSPASLPGRIEAEEYDLDGEGVAYHDTSVGNAGGQFRTDDVDIEDAGSGSNYGIGYVSGGEWLEYSVNVTSSGSYDISFALSSPYTGNTIHLEVDETNVTGSVNTPNTGGWKNWQIVTVPGVALTAGTHEVRIHFEDGGQNIDYVDFAIAGSGARTATPALSMTAEVYPNPVSDVLTVRGLTSGAELMIYDMTGAQIRKVTVSSDNFELNVRDMKAGIYLIRTESSAVPLRFIKQ